MDALGDVWGLLLQRHEHIAGLEVKAWAEGKQAPGGTYQTQGGYKPQDVQVLVCSCARGDLWLAGTCLGPEPMPEWGRPSTLTIT